jgi:hypothetical protein
VEEAIGKESEKENRSGLRDKSLFFYLFKGVEEEMNKKGSGNDWERKRKRESIRIQYKPSFFFIF